MRTIEIRTTQNVTITYELANVRDRILAFIIDLVAMGIGFGILCWIFFGIISLSGDLIVVWWLLVLPFPIFYSLAFESWNNGQSLGKMALRIKVVKLDGKQLTFFDYLLRWCFRLIDIYLCLGSLAAILASSTDHGQRLGGLVSNSTVVRLKPTLFVSLQDILKIKTVESYEPQYHAIRNFREQDMLLIKQALERYQKYRNKSHRQALINLSDRVSERLALTEKPKDRIDFLKTVIKDYIVLTR